MKDIKKITLTMISDPSHGWLKVPRRLLNQLNLQDKVSVCSYQRGEDVYLEEDSDATMLLKKMSDAKINFTIKDSYTNKSCKVRSYSQYIKRG